MTKRYAAIETLGYAILKAARMGGGDKMIYFIRSKSAGAIKIGCSVDPHARLATLQTSSPDELELLGCAEGGKTEEAYLHRVCHPWHLRGEWFRDTPDLREAIRGWVGATFTHDETVVADLAALRPLELLAYQQLVRLLVTHGKMAFSTRGPLGPTIDAKVKGMAREVADACGNHGLHQVFDAVEQFATRRWGADRACVAMAALDHRFDSVGGWWA